MTAEADRHRARADPVRQLGDPPERRRGRRPPCGLGVHHDGRTASGSATVVDDDDVDGLVERVVASPCASPRCDPTWPGLAAARRRRRDRRRRRGDRRGLARRPGRGGPGVRRRAPAGWRRPATAAPTTGPARSPTRPGSQCRGEAAECGLAGIARARRRRRRGPARRRCASPTSTAPPWAPAPRPRPAPGPDPVELPPGRYEVVLEPTAVLDLLGNLAIGRLQRQGGQRAPLVRRRSAPSSSTRRSRSSTTRWLAGLGFDAEGTPRQRLALVDGGRTVAVTHDRRTAAEAGAVEHRPPRASTPSSARSPRHLALAARGPADGGRRRGRRTGVRLLGRRARGRRRARPAGLGLLVHPRARPAHPRDHRPDPQRRLADRGRRDRPRRCATSGSPSPTRRHWRRATCSASGAPPTPVPGDTYTTTSPRWTCPALHLASWNFTGGSAG